MAQRLLGHFLEKGIMRNFIQLDCTTKTSKISLCVPVNIEFEWPRASPSLTYQVPIFIDLFKRKAPKECVVCAEDKLEIDIGSWMRWTRACAHFRGPWMWTILEYPVQEHQRCNHSLDICRSCIAKHISIRLESGHANSIICPQCDRDFTYDEIRNLCTKETFLM